MLRLIRRRFDQFGLGCELFSERARLWHGKCRFGAAVMDQSKDRLSVMSVNPDDHILNVPDGHWVKSCSWIQGTMSISDQFCEFLSRQS